MALPSMHALMVFEVAGRHESFLNAATELNVTPSAVSHQIGSLEAMLGARLFKRENRKVTLTRRGKAYWKAIHTHFSHIRDETEALFIGKSSRTLTFRCSMVLMRYWLMPRLSLFYERHPGVNIAFQIARSDQPPAPEEDCGIRAGSGSYNGLESRYLFTGRLVPVCSRSYLERHPPIRSVLDLRYHTLLHSRFKSERWSRWLGDVAEPVLAPARHLRFEGEGLLYQAAIEGLGVALGRERLLAAELASEQLVAPLGDISRHDEGYYFIYRPQDHFPPGFEAFRSWIFEQSRQDQQKPATLAGGLAAPVGIAAGPG